MRRLVLASATVLMSAAGFGSAKAAIITYTYTGTVTSGMDGAGLFATMGSDLTDRMFKVIETFDTSKASTAHAPYTDGKTYSEGEGGSNLKEPSFATSRVTIGGQTISVSPITYAEAYSLKGTKSQEDYTLVQSLVSSENYYKNEYSNFNAYSSLLSYDYRQPGVYTSANTIFDGSFSYEQGASEAAITRYTYANFEVSKLVISAVPLPASAPMFGAALIAFAIFGYGWQRRSVRIQA